MLGCQCGMSLLMNSIHALPGPALKNEIGTNYARLGKASALLVSRIRYPSNQSDDYLYLCLHSHSSTYNTKKIRRIPCVQTRWLVMVFCRLQARPVPAIVTHSHCNRVCSMLRLEPSLLHQPSIARSLRLILSPAAIFPHRLDYHLISHLDPACHSLQSPSLIPQTSFQKAFVPHS